MNNKINMELTEINNNINNINLLKNRILHLENFLKDLNEENKQQRKCISHQRKKFKYIKDVINKDIFK